MNTRLHAVALTALNCLLLYGSQAAAGRLFEWVDADGMQHFSDRAPTGVPYTETVVVSASGEAAPGSRPGLREGERRLLEVARQREAATRRARFADAQQLEAQRARCKRARQHYRTATHRPRSAGGGGYKSLWKRMKEACR